MAEQNKVESAPESLEDMKKKFKAKKKDTLP